MTLSKTLHLTITGQCPSGKNAITVTRTGLRFPSLRFKKWREHASKQISEHKLNRDFPIDKPCSIMIFYWAGDLRRRDCPGMIDAVYHLLEKCNIVSDDTFLGGLNRWASFFNNGLDRENPRIEIKIFYE